MKKLLFASAAILLAFISTQAQTNDAIDKNDNKVSKEERKEIRKEKKEERIALKGQPSANVNYQAKQEFYRQFGNHPEAIWTNANNFDEASFIKDGISTKAFYDFNGELVGTTCLKTFADLPEDGQKQIRKEYKDYTVKGVVFFDDNENNDTNMILYNTAFDDEDNYFVELENDSKTVVVQVTTDGLVSYFTALP